MMFIYKIRAIRTIFWFMLRQIFSNGASWLLYTVLLPAITFSALNSAEAPALRLRAEVIALPIIGCALFFIPALMAQMRNQNIFGLFAAAPVSRVFVSGTFFSAVLLSALPGLLLLRALSMQILPAETAPGMLWSAGAALLLFCALAAIGSIIGIIAPSTSEAIGVSLAITAPFCVILTSGLFTQVPSGIAGWALRATPVSAAGNMLFLSNTAAKHIPELLFDIVAMLLIAAGAFGLFDAAIPWRVEMKPDRAKQAARLLTAKSAPRAKNG